MNTIVEIILITIEPKTQAPSIITRTATSTAIDLIKISNMTKDFPRENSFRQNEYAAKQFYERENSQFNRNQAHSNIRPTLQQDTT